MFQVLKDNPAFKRLFLGQITSFCGDWFNYVAVITLMGDIRGGGIMALAWLMVLKQLPVFLFSAAGGVFADRFSRRKIMLYSDFIRGILALLIIPASSFGSTPVLVLIGLSAIVSAFFDPARTAAMPQLVPPEQLRAANALGSICWSLSMLVGTALGGIATEFLGVKTALFLDAVSFGISAWFIYPIPALMPKKQADDSIHKVSFRDFIFNRLFNAERKVAVLIKGLFGIGGAINFIQSVIGLSLSVGETGAGGLSATFCARAFGAMCGMLFSKKFFESKSEFSVVIAGFFLSGFAYFSVGITDSIPLFLIAMFVAHFGSSLTWVYSTIWVQRIFENDERGRASGLDVGLFMLTSCIVTVICGELLSQNLMTARGAAEMCGLFWIVLGFALLPLKRRIAAKL
jgi:MFS family permease